MIYPIIFQAIVLCWGLILVLAGIFCVTSGHLWPLESILGIKPAEIKTSKDIRDRNYVSPNDTSPETSRAIFWGEITVIFGLLLFSFKLISFIILKILYEYYLQFDIEDYDYY
uniref:Uncharacterized protein n=1 Tax=Panagrolaimus sp. JU765 TaxID=591449 RepID=A0AC34R9Z2_9BILA